MAPEHLPSERRAAAQDRLRHLMRERTRTLALFSGLAAMRPFKPGREVHHALREFCEALVDYTASAHFLIYRFLAEGVERRSSLQAFGEAVYPRILATTERIVAFNDAYAAGEHCADLRSLASDLSELGEVLADRILLEDRIIDTYLAQR